MGLVGIRLKMKCSSFGFCPVFSLFALFFYFVFVPLSFLCYFYCLIPHLSFFFPFVLAFPLWQYSSDCRKGCQFASHFYSIQWQISWYGNIYFIFLTVWKKYLVSWALEEPCGLRSSLVSFILHCQDFLFLPLEDFDANSRKVLLCQSACSTSACGNKIWTWPYISFLSFCSDFLLLTCNFFFPDSCFFFFFLFSPHVCCLFLYVLNSIEKCY